MEATEAKTGGEMTLEKVHKVCDVCGKRIVCFEGIQLSARLETMASVQARTEWHEIKEIYGKTEHCICWCCTLKAFGVKSVKDQKSKETQLWYGH